MGQISLQSPTVGQPNSTEDPKITSDFNVLQTWANGNIDITNISSAFALSSGVNQGGQTMKGGLQISTSQSTGSTTYTTLSTPDQITGITMPASGLIAVWFQAVWQESVSNAGRATIFLGANQVQAATTSAPLPIAASIGTGSTGSNYPLATFSGGLLTATGSPGGGYTGDVTTGQIVGNATNAGPCYIFANGNTTYTVSIQFLASSGTVTVGARKLWVEAKSFT